MDSGDEPMFLRRALVSGQVTVKRLAKRVIGPAQIDESQIVHAVLKEHRGVMLDIGAHYGDSLAPFAADGWDVHAFEPDPANRARLETRFGEDSNVRIVPKGVSDAPGQLPLYTSDESSGISSLAPFTASHKPTATVEVITLHSYLTASGIAAVDFMKIDVEGFERHVLRGFDWAVRPNMIVLEFEDSKTIPLGYDWKDLADELLGHGYEILVSEWFPVQRYGTAHTWRRFARYPTELAHPDAWGNMIAADSLSAVLPTAKRVAMRYRIRKRVERFVRR